MTAQIQKYLDCAQQRMSQAETARFLGVSREAVRQMANRHGIEFRPAANKDLESVRREMARVAAEKELTADAASEVTGLARSTLWRYGERFRRKQNPHPRVDQIAELAAQGMTVSEVARKLGIHQSNVSMAKKAHNIGFLRDGRSA